MKSISSAVKNAIHPAWGWLAIALGMFPITLAFNLLKVPDTSILAPRWVLALSGIVFVLGGCMMLLQQRKHLIAALAAMMCLAFTAIGFWVAVYAPPEGFSGGVPLLAREVNITISRWVFGIGATLVFLLFVYALRRAIKGKDASTIHLDQ